MIKSRSDHRFHAYCVNIVSWIYWELNKQAVLFYFVVAMTCCDLQNPRTKLFKTHKTTNVSVKPGQNRFPLIFPASHIPNASLCPPPPRGGGTANNCPVWCYYFLALPLVCVEMSSNINFIQICTTDVLSLSLKQDHLSPGVTGYNDWFM